jgi:DegV family protein with EDD domain
MSKIALITDSTAYIPEHYCQEYNITVLPQILIWGADTYRDGVDIKPKEFYERLATAKIMPSTSQVTPAAFRTAYENLCGEGYEILAILISSRLSGTIDSALQAIEMVPEAKVEIFDSYTSAMALGFQVLAAARTIAQGGGMDQAKATLEQVRDKTGVILTPETLEFLHRGGRIGSATRFLGTALNIKPILEVHNGLIEPLERVRTRKKALQRMVDMITERAAGKPIRLASLSANEPASAEAVLEMAKNQMTIVESFVGDVSPVIGTHVGPGTVAVSYLIEG